MNLKSLASNFSVAVLAQGTTLVINFIITLVVPKVLGVTEFSYWQLFVFYSSYVGFFHFGLNDGVYLINGGKARSEIDHKSVISQFCFAAAAQMIIGLLIVVAALFSALPEQRSFVIISTAFFMLMNNLSLYLGYVFQAMNETKLFSYSAILERILFLLPLLVLLFMHVTSFKPYVIINLVSATCRLLFCLWFSKDFLHSGLLSVRKTLDVSLSSIRVGIKLMIANIASTLILGIARFIIDAVWGIQTFGKLSLSLSMVTFFLAFVSQASMVLFPALRQSKGDEVKHFYTIARDFFGLAFPIVYLLYFPLVWVLSLWLPEYQTSFIYFAYLLPICVFDSKMNITATTLFKVRREESILLRINIVTVIFSAIGSLIGGYLIHSVFVIIATTVLAIAGRSIFSEWYLTERLNARKNHIFIGEILLTLIFITLTTFTTDLVAIIGYITAYILFLVVFRAQIHTLGSGTRLLLHKNKK